MAPTSQTGKASPRVIEPRGDGGTRGDGGSRGDGGERGGSVASARVPAYFAAATVSISALVAVAAVLSTPVASPQGEPPAAGVALAAVASVAPVALVAILALLAAGARPALAGALTAGYGAVAVGLTVLDIGLVLSPIDANRLELFRPTTAEALAPGVGAYLSIAAHALAVVAGLVGLVAVDRASYGDGHGSSTAADLAGRASAVRIGTPLAVIAAGASVVGAAAMFAPPYDSTDSIVLVPAVVDAPLTTAIGSGLVALAVLVVVAAALASVSPTVAAGAVLGSGLGLFGISGAHVAAGTASGPSIEVSTGAWAAAVASIVLVAVGLVVLPAAAWRDRRGGTTEIARRDLADSGQFMRWHVIAGTAGVLAGILLGVSGLLPVLSVPAGLPDPEILAARVAVVAGFALVLASVTMFFSLFAATVRPALGVLMAAGVMSGASVLQSVVLATDIDGIGVGVGGIAAVVAVILAAVGGLAVLIAGSAERDDVDTSDIRPDATVGTVAAVGAVVGAIGLGTPLYRGTDVSAASFAEFPWGFDAWGQAFLAVTVVVAAVVSARSRPARATALLVGSVIALVVYVLGWPLTQGRALDPTVGPGVVAGLLGAVILAVAAALSARRQGK